MSGEPPTQPAQVAPGTTVDHFKVIRLVGRGGMGEVFLARDTKLGRKVALKVIHPSALGDQRAARRFLREAQVTARFNHPHIVSIFAVGEWEGSPYVALEYLEGHTLRQRLADQPLGLKAALRVGLAIAEALAEAHRHDVLHRDLKPENVVIPRDGRLRVVDFGLAKSGAAPVSQRDPVGLETVEVMPLAAREPVVAQSSEVVSAGLAVTLADARGAPGLGANISGVPTLSAAGTNTARGGLLGTPFYMAPEQWFQESCTATTDVWALGVILFEMLAGRHPYEAAGSYSALSQEVMSDEPAPTLGETGLPTSLVDLVAACLAKLPADRPSAAEVTRRLREQLAWDRDGLEDDHNPFRGLLPFTEEHAHLFHGREAEVAAFVERLRSEPVLPIVGPSGAGKSSFVQAGVVPRLREHERWTVLRLRPGRQPFDALAARLAAGSSVTLTASRRSSPSLRPPADGPTADEIRAQLRREPSSLVLLLGQLAQAEQAPVLLVVDQLEELYTLVEDEQLRRDFMAALCTAADDPQEPVRAVFTLRDDFLGRMAEGPAAREAFSRVTVLRSPGPEALKETLELPVRRAGYRFDDPDLVAAMVAAVSGEPAALPLLQFAASQLWESRDRDAKLLRRGDYDAMGGVEGALARQVDRVLDGLSVEQVHTAKELLLRLVTPDGTRRVVPASELLEGLAGDGEEVLDRLVRERAVLMRKARRGGADAAEVELVHESLIRAWDRLARWLDESREEMAFLADVGQAAELWDRRGRRPEEAWQGDALHDALRKRRSTAGKVPPLVPSFLAAGLRQERLRQRRRRFAVVVGFGLLAAVAIVLAVQYREANRQRGLAEQQRSEADVRRAEALREGARAALSRQEVLEARAKVRASLEVMDSPLARALFARLRRDPLRWKAALAITPLAVAISPDGRTVASAGQDGLVHLFDAHTRRNRILRGHTDQVYSVDFSPDGRRLATSTWSGAVGLWDVESGSGTFLKNHEQTWTCRFDPSGKRLAVGLSQQGVEIWDAANGALLQRLPSDSGGARSISFDGDGDRLATGGEDEVVRIWSLSSGTAIGRIDRDVVPGAAVALSPDGRRVAYAASDDSVRVVAVDSGVEQLRLAGHAASVRTVAFSRDGSTLGSAGDDHTIRLWNAADGALARSLDGHDNVVRQIAFSTDGQLLASAGSDRTVRLWDLAVPGQPAGQHGHDAEVWRVAVHPDGKRFASASLDQTVRIWDVASARQLQLLRGHSATIASLAFSPDGRILASGADDSNLLLWRVDEGTKPTVLRDHSAGLWDLSFSADGRWLASASADATVRLWDVQRLTAHAVLPGDAGALYSVVWSPDGQHLFAGSQGGAVVVWDARRQRKLRTISVEAAIWGLAMSPDGDRLVLSTEDGQLVWLTVEGGDRHQVKTTIGRNYWLAFFPDGHRVAVPSSDGTVKLMDLRDQSAVTLWGHRSEVGTVRLTPDGKLAVTASDDWTVRVWDTDTGRPLWRAPLIRRDPPELLTHRGWHLFDEDVVRQTMAGKWRHRLQTDARVASEAHSGRHLCVGTYGGHVEAWSVARDERLTRQPLPEVAQVEALPTGCVARSRGGSVHLVGLTGEPVVLAEGASAMARTEDAVLMAVGGEVIELDLQGERRRTLRSDVGATALGRVGKWIVVGYPDGNLQLVGAGDGAAAPSHVFEEVPPSPVTKIAPGPMGTLIAGFANGVVGLWKVDDGTMLDRIRVHGPITHLMIVGDRLHAASELGDHAELDLSVFHRSRCEVLRLVWAAVPVVWSAGAAEMAPPPRHDCEP